MFNVRDTPVIAIFEADVGTTELMSKLDDVPDTPILDLASTSENPLTVKEEVAAGNTILACASSSVNS